MSVHDSYNNNTSSNRNKKCNDKANRSMKIFRFNSFKDFKNTGIPCFAKDEPQSNKFDCQLTIDDVYLILLGLTF